MVLQIKIQRSQDMQSAQGGGGAYFLTASAFVPLGVCRASDVGLRTPLSLLRETDFSITVSPNLFL